MPEPDPEHLFVYGTLLTGLRAHPMLANRARLVGRGRVPGCLYDAGSYPAAVLGGPGAGWISGEVYHLPEPGAARLLAELDRYEGYRPGATERSLFTRTSAEVILAEGGSCRAWIYGFAREPEGLTRIESGDYLNPAD